MSNVKVKAPKKPVKSGNRSDLYPAGDPGSYLSGSASVDAVRISER